MVIGVVTQEYLLRTIMCQMMMLMLTILRCLVSGSVDANGNPQLLQKDPVSIDPEAEFNLDTENPDASTLSIVVNDTDQTEGDAATSFTVSTN